MNKKTVLQKTVLAGLFTALSLVLIALIRIPIIPAAPWLVLDGGDIPALLAGFLLGPWWGLAVNVASSLIQGFAFSSDGIVGAAMHILSTGLFVVLSGALYRRFHTFRGALLSLLAGAAAFIAVILPVNVLITPAFYGMPTQAVVDLILPALLPFNAIKAAVNIALVLLLYKPISRAVKSFGWLEKDVDKNRPDRV